MTEPKKAKVIQFPGNRAAKEQPKSNVLEELKASLQGAPATAAATQDKPQQHIVINGASAQVVTGEGSITNNTYNVSTVPKPTVIVQTGVGVIDAQQKRRLLDLRDDVVEASKAGAKLKTPQSVMTALNKYMKVNTYSEILAEDFEKAVKWLYRQRAIKTGLRSASKKLGDWRNRRIGAIHARCKEKGFETWRMEHMKKKFGKDSMIDLGDDDLEALYRTVMTKK